MFQEATIRALKSVYHMEQKTRKRCIMNKHRMKNIIGGIILLLVAVALVLYKLDIIAFDIFAGLSLWQIILGIVLLYFLVHSLFFHRSAGGTFFSLAFMGIVFSNELHIEKLVPWTLLVAALLATIAFEMIFGKKGHRDHFKYSGDNRGGMHHGNSNVITESVEGDVINEKISFTGVTKYIHSENFTSANIDCSFAGAEFYFDKAAIPSGRAVITVNSSFCGMTLFVPRNWEVQNDINSFFGGVDVEMSNQEPVATLVLKGSNSFAGIEVRRS